ncbi:MAG: alpha amylase N-terminal ig-like domain-containing protein [Bdellovibrionales bacterium]|nr:alpha amylase N-terminal ig-like domain-containing protein [Bdellovibrionales bacterium]
MQKGAWKLVSLAAALTLGLFLIRSVILSVNDGRVATAKVIGPCLGAKIGDKNIFWAGLLHNTFQPEYRYPFGSVRSDQGSVLVRLRTCINDVDSVRLLVKSARDQEGERDFEMKPSALLNSQGAESGFMYWEYSLPIENHTDILSYIFEIRDRKKTAFYADDDLLRAPGGVGRPSDEMLISQAFQVVVYQSDFSVPEWAKGAIVYQIFPDRYRNGDPSNDPQTGSGFIYGKKALKKSWSQPLCGTQESSCRDQAYNTFYGGDLRGIRQKLPEIRALGSSVLYLNPIFEAPTNHRYDVSNYWKIDPRLGTQQDFLDLVASAKKLGIRVITEGIFSHVSADSPYFDLYGRWNDKLQLMSTGGPGTNDGSGACESAQSRWRSWFFFPSFSYAAENWERKGLVQCPGVRSETSHEAPTTYEAWYGFFNHPRLNTRHPELRSFFYGNAEKSVIPHWTSLGINGWRLDAVDLIDAGEIVDPGNGFWREFRSALKKIDKDAWIVGEWWGNSSVWLLGNEWDSVTNYLFRSALLDWMFDECRGHSCDGNRQFSDNDSNDQSRIGTIRASTDSQFMNRLKGIQEQFPDPAWRSAMNVLSSHDTNRILFLLKKITKNEDSRVALRKLRVLLAFMMTYPGAPTLYYGDEVGLAPDGVWWNHRWEDDPYNRAPYPWSDLGLASNQDLLRYTKSLGQLRLKEPALRDGDFNVISSDDRRRVLVFSREIPGTQLVVVMNRSEEAQDVVLGPGLTLDSKSEFVEVFPNSGQVYSVKNSVVLMKRFEGLSVKVLRRR